MNKKKLRSGPEAASFTQARDELFSHILRCGVIDALPSVFDVDRWPGRDPGERFDAFRGARRAHLERYGWPGGADVECATLPDEPWWEGII